MYCSEEQKATNYFCHCIARLDTHETTELDQKHLCACLLLTVVIECNWKGYLTYFLFKPHLSPGLFHRIHQFTPFWFWLFHSRINKPIMTCSSRVVIYLSFNSSPTAAQLLKILMCCVFCCCWYCSVLVHIAYRAEQCAVRTPVQYSSLNSPGHEIREDGIHMMA